MLRQLSDPRVPKAKTLLAVVWSLTYHDFPEAKLMVPGLLCQLLLWYQTSHC